MFLHPEITSAWEKQSLILEQKSKQKIPYNTISRTEKPLKTKVGIVSEGEVELQCQQTALENPLNLNLRRRNISQEGGAPKKHA